jgi:hypothetical protein
MTDCSDLKALLINTTLASTLQGESHTEKLMCNSVTTRSSNRTMATISITRRMTTQRMTTQQGLNLL